MIENALVNVRHQGVVYTSLEIFTLKAPALCPAFPGMVDHAPEVGDAIVTQ